MSQNVPETDKELLELLLKRLDSTPNNLEELQAALAELNKLSDISDEQGRIIDRTTVELGAIKRDLDIANKRLDDIKDDFDKEVEKLNTRVDTVTNSRSKYIESGLMLILGALVPAVINLLIH